MYVNLSLSFPTSFHSLSRFFSFFRFLTPNMHYSDRASTRLSYVFHLIFIFIPVLIFIFICTHIHTYICPCIHMNPHARTYPTHIYTSRDTNVYIGYIILYQYKFNIVHIICICMHIWNTYIFAHASKIYNAHTLVKARNLQRSVMSIRVHRLDFEEKMHFSTRMSLPVQKCWVVALLRRSDYERYKVWVYLTSKLRINIAWDEFHARLIHIQKKKGYPIQFARNTPHRNF